MCGRTALFIPQDDLESRVDARIAAADDYQPRFNIAPEDPIETTTNQATNEIDKHRWGLVPHWADDPDDRFVNARSERAPEKSSFRDT